MEINFKKVHTVKDLAISTMVFLAGMGLFFINKGLGICLAICGLMMFPIYKAGYRKDGQGAVLTKKSEDLTKDCRASVIEFLNGKDVTPEIKEGCEGGSVRLDVYYNEAEDVAYAQLFDFCNYSYKPVTEVMELNREKAERLLSQL